MAEKTAAMRNVEYAHGVEIEQELRRRYAEEKQSVGRIARDWAVEASTVWRWLKVLGIPSRPRSRDGGKGDGGVSA